MRAVIVIAPAGAHWADRAAIALMLQRVHVARLPTTRFVASLMVAGGAGAILVDHRSLDASWPGLRDRLHAIKPGLRLVVVAEDGHDVDGATPWPSEPSAGLDMVTGRR
jgi:hypothetical protein